MAWVLVLRVGGGEVCPRDSADDGFTPCSALRRALYEKILQSHGVNTRKYWLVEVIENDCIVT